MHGTQRSISEVQPIVIKRFPWDLKSIGISFSQIRLNQRKDAIDRISLME